jgi:hypothetical protein
MPYGVPIPAVDTALRAQMVAAASLTALLAVKPAARGGGPAIYDEGDVYQGQTFPYLTIGAWTQAPQHRFSPGTDGYGWTLTVQVKAIGQRSEAQLFAILNEVFALFPQGEALTVTGYGSAWADEFTIVQTFKSIEAGVTTYQSAAILRVNVQS